MEKRETPREAEYNYENPYQVPRRVILKQARDDPILYQCLTVWQRGDITFEQAMIAAAFQLSKVNQDLKSQLIAEKDLNVRPSIPRP